MSFTISVPELCLIRFCVRDQTGFLSSDFVGQYTLPFTSLQRGETQRTRGRTGWRSVVWLHRVNRHCRPLLFLSSAVPLWLVSFSPESLLADLCATYVISSDAFLYSHPPPSLRFPLQATAGCPFAPETDAAWIQPRSSSLFGFPKNSFSARTHTHTYTQPHKGAYVPCQQIGEANSNENVENV